MNVCSFLLLIELSVPKNIIRFLVGCFFVVHFSSEGTFKLLLLLLFMFIIQCLLSVYYI